MKRRLYPNMKHMTTMFCVAIVCMTVCALMLRLTVFSEMAVYASAGGRPASGADAEGSELFSFSNIRFRSVDAEGDVLIYNPEANDFLMTVSIMRSDTQETLIYTGLIEPGQSKSTSLNLYLEKGDYDCVAEVTTYDRFSNEVLDKEQHPVTIQVG